jgi:CheY-like chemotaxis protein
MPADNGQNLFPEHRHDFSNHTILVAEDIDINREIMSAILAETGISMEFAENGKVAVSMFSANPGKYDLILMDINMPEIDGYEATRRIRAMESEYAQNIPILAMTANVFKEDIEKCLAAGMNGHTGKPIDVHELTEKLHKYFVSEKESGA